METKYIGRQLSAQDPLTLISEVYLAAKQCELDGKKILGEIIAWFMTTKYGNIDVPRISTKCVFHVVYRVSSYFGL